MDHIIFAFFVSPSPSEMMVVAVVALLLFGGKLPDVARSWGKTFADFRRGLSGIHNELNEVIYSEPDQLEYRDDTHFGNGYEEADPYQEESADLADDEPDADPLDEGEKTVSAASAETIAIKESEIEMTDIEKTDIDETEEKQAD